jgi:hypothetical protein
VGDHRAVHASGGVSDAGSHVQGLHRELAARTGREEVGEALRDGVEGAGGRLVCLHSSGGGVAYGVVEGPHDYDALLAVLGVITAIAGEVISLLTGD